jgi:hypothetical protein
MAIQRDTEVQKLLVEAISDFLACAAERNRKVA